MITKEQRIWSAIASFVLAVAASLALLPFILLVIASLSSEQSVLQNGYTYFPSAFSLDAYRYIFQEGRTFLRYTGTSLLVTAVGTVASVMITTMFAFTLSQSHLPGRKFILMSVLITMLFNAGLVPTYIMYTRYLHINDTLLAYIFPNLLMNGFMVMIVKSYFDNSIPAEIYEAAEIDGAGPLRLFFHVGLPLAKPIVVTIGLLNMISYWNDWQNGLYYIKDNSLLTLPVFLNRVNDSISFLASNATGVHVQLPTSTVRMAIAVAAILPIIIIYPFLHKYFEKGMTLGAVKG